MKNLCLKYIKKLYNIQQELRQKNIIKTTWRMKNAKL